MQDPIFSIGAYISFGAGQVNRISDRIYHYCFMVGTLITGNARWSILGIIPLFLIGLVIFMTLPKEQKNDER